MGTCLAPAHFCALNSAIAMPSGAVACAGPDYIAASHDTRRQRTFRVTRRHSETSAHVLNLRIAASARYPIYSSLLRE
eukprot:6188666-Pleurochrysis_carterae.AAC.1